MVDCTRTLPYSTPVCRTQVLALTISLIALVLSAFPAAAAADGDPASDVLATQTVYLPQDTGATATQQSGLGAIETAAQKSGYQIRVAMIATPSDLGSVGALWHQPQSYAEFLGQELSILYRGTLLVVMPNGFGLYEERSPDRSRAVGARVDATSGKCWARGWDANRDPAAGQGIGPHVAGELAQRALPARPGMTRAHGSRSWLAPR